MEERPPRGAFPIWHALLGSSGWVLWLFYQNIPIAVFAGILTILALPRFIRGSLEEAEEQIARDLRLPVQPSRRVAKVMFKSEHLLLELRPHPICMAWWWVGTVLLGSGAIALGFFVSTLVPSLVIFLIAALTMTIRFVVWQHDRICLTNHRIFVVQGWMALTREFMPLHKMANEALHIPWQSRILAQLRLIRAEYGTIQPEGAGEEGALGNLRFIPYAEVVNVLIAEHVIGK